MWFPQESAKTILNEILYLNSTGREQDWDIELSDPDRIDDFLTLLKATREVEMEEALLSLILSSFEDAKYEEKFRVADWEQLTGILVAKNRDYSLVIEKWLPKNMSTGNFKISKIVAELGLNFTR
jgi:hypothetical protein